MISLALLSIETDFIGGGFCALSAIGLQSKHVFVCLALEYESVFNLGESGFNHVGFAP